MADLENLLLECAGRSMSLDGHQDNSKTRKRRPSFSDSENGSDSNKYSEPDDSDQDDEMPNLKHSKMPLKKRFETGDRDDDDRYSDSDSSYRSDLYKDDEEKEMMQKKSEFEREMLLAERAEKRDSKQLIKSAAERHPPPSDSKKSNNNNNHQNQYREMRSSVRGADKGKARALTELIAKKRKAQDTDSQRRRNDKASKDSSPSRDDGSENEDSEGEANSESHEGSPRGNKRGKDDEEEEDSGAASYADICKITIKRSKLAKWFMEPFFESIIEGCFVRLGIGEKHGRRYYRLCRVKNVDASSTDPKKKYTFEKRATFKYLNCFWGDESNAARWQMIRVSDSSPDELEYVDLREEMERKGGRMIRTDEVEEKLTQLEQINNYVYSAETVKQMLQEKKMASQRPSNIAAEKEKLRKELMHAESMEDQEEAERIRMKLRELEVISNQSKNKNEKALMLAEMNRKNRAENFRVASESKRANANLKAGEAGYDPFSRRWTRSHNYYASKVSNANEAVPEAEKQPEETKVEETEKDMKVAVEEGKLINTEAPPCIGSKVHALHNFELDLSPDLLNRYGGAQGAPAAFMVRRQQLEARYGIPIPSNDGKRHSLTLTVDDYKRRRGLM